MTVVDLHGHLAVPAADALIAGSPGFAAELAAKAAPGLPVVALILPENTPSLRVAERLGLRLEGEVERQLGVYLKYSVIPAL